MTLLSLTLTNFRNYTKHTVSFSPRTTILVGPNAAGKTNILEALCILATGKSFRADEEKEVVRWGSQASGITCSLGKTRDEHVSLEVRITEGVKKYLVNGVSRRQLDFVGNLRVVLFWPEHLELVTDSPGTRRKYLDSVLVQTDREYRRNLLSYERGVRQRNKLLERIREGEAGRSQLGFWDQLLIKSGGYLTDKRHEYIEFVNHYPIPNIQYTIEYDASVISESRLEQYKDAEIAAAATLVGPHRDDFLVASGDRDMSKFGSRGEQRLAVLWLKMAELAYIELRTGEKPVLLLDDIFSELDVAHRKLVMDVMTGQQTVLTAANEDIIKLVPRESTVIRL